MNRNPVIALAAVAIGLFAFIVLYERHTLSTGEVSEARHQLLDRFVRARVDRIEITRPDDAVVLERHREDDDLLGIWRVEEPFSALADEDVISSLLGAVQYAAARRTLEGVSDADRARFGLDAPPVIARFRVANEWIELRFGAQDPTETGLYMAEGDKVHVVGRDVFEALDRGPDHFRSKRLLERGVATATAARIESSDADPVELRLREDRWRLGIEGGEVLAAVTRVEEALQSFTDVTALRFAGEDAALGETWLRVVAEVPGLEDEDPSREVTLTVGQECEGGRLARTVTEESGETETSAIGCVSTSALAGLSRPVDEWRETRPITARDLELEVVELTRAGAGGADTTLRVAQDEGVWLYTLTAGTRTLGEGEVDDQALGDWIQAIRRARARSFVPVTDGVLGAYGLTSPSGTLRVTDNEGRTMEVALGTVSAEGLYARRGDEPQILVLPESAEELFVPRATRLRAPLVLDVAAGDIESITIVSGGREDALTKGDEGWTRSGPVAVDDDEVRALARTLGRLTAAAFVADAPDASHGFAGDQVRFTLGDDTHTVHLGGVTPEGADPAGRYARLGDDSAVFVWEESSAARVSFPLVPDDLLATQILYIDSVHLEGEGRALELTHDGQRFTTDDGPLEGDESEALGGAIERFRTQRAERLGDPDPAMGFASPRLTATVHRGNEAEPPRRYQILVGAPTGEGSSYVRRDDLPVVFVVRDADLEPFFATLRR